jgi:hypothetical protein
MLDRVEGLDAVAQALHTGLDRLAVESGEVVTATCLKRNARCCGGRT